MDQWPTMWLKAKLEALNNNYVLSFFHITLIRKVVIYLITWLLIYIFCVYIFNVIQVLPGSDCIFMFFTQINLTNVLYLLKINFAECDYTYIHIYFYNVSHFVIFIVH